MLASESAERDWERTDPCRSEGGDEGDAVQVASSLIVAQVTLVNQGCTSVVRYSRGVSRNRFKLTVLKLKKMQN